MRELPFITIISAARNARESISRCIDSVSSQASVDLEHVIIDGASTDGTQKIIQGAALHNERLRWISEPDSGIAEAMNKGIRMARGQWLLFLHADDQLISGECLEHAAEHLRSSPCIVSFRVELKSGHGGRTLIDNPGWCLKTRFKTSLGHQGALIHRDLFERIGPYDETFKIAMDYDWFMRAFRAGIPLHRRDEVLSVMQDTGISSRKDWSSLAFRFSEEKRVHTKSASGVVWRAIYFVYWTLYPAYRKLKYNFKRSEAD